MIERQIDVATPDGATTTFICHIPQRAACDEAVAERRWERLNALCRRRLG